MHLRGGQGHSRQKETLADGISNGGPARKHGGSMRTSRLKSTRDEKDKSTVGLKYQESTPLLQGHVDTPKERSAESYAAEAARCLSQLRVDEACSCYEAALQVEPKAAWLLDAYGALLADMGKPKKALKLFRKSVEVEPRGSHVKHMYIAQCAVGEEAIRHLRQGVEILDERRSLARKRAELGGGADEVSEVSPMLCTAQSSLAEALLAFDDTGGADEEAEALLLSAKRIDPSSPDPHQALASLRLSQERAADAGAAMQAVLRIFSESNVECMPSIDFRLQSARLLIELGLIPDALKVLRMIERERDDLAELWYLRCFALRLAGDEGGVREAARRGKAHLAKVGGAEMTRNPVSGELLELADFDDVARGVGVSPAELAQARPRTRPSAARGGGRGVSGGRAQDERDDLAEAEAQQRDAMALGREQEAARRAGAGGETSLGEAEPALSGGESSESAGPGGGAGVDNDSLPDGYSSA